MDEEGFLMKFDGEGRYQWTQTVGVARVPRRGYASNEAIRDLAVGPQGEIRVVALQNDPAGKVTSTLYLVQFSDGGKLKQAYPLVPQLDNTTGSIFTLALDAEGDFWISGKGAHIFPSPGAPTKQITETE